MGRGASRNGILAVRRRRGADLGLKMGKNALQNDVWGLKMARNGAGNGQNGLKTAKIGENGAKQPKTWGELRMTRMTRMARMGRKTGILTANGREWTQMGAETG